MLISALAFLIAAPYVVARRLWAALTPAPLALPPAVELEPCPLQGLTVAQLRTMAARSRRFSRRFYTYGRRAELLAALAPMVSPAG